MTAIRHILIPIPLTAAAVAGPSVPAWAAYGTTFPMTQTAAGVLSTSQTVDADNLAYHPPLSVTTLTSYGWMRQSAISGYISC